MEEGSILFYEETQSGEWRSGTLRLRQDDYFLVKNKIDQTIEGHKETEYECKVNLPDESRLSLNAARKSIDPSKPSPLGTLVDDILEWSVLCGASDIHLEPYKNKLRVRYRLDGILNTMWEIEPGLMPGVISKIKIMADLDIAEKRLPQEGRFLITYKGREVIFRVSTLPTIYGEKLMLRILDQGRCRLKLSSLGILNSNMEAIQELLRHNRGLIVVTGPAGSGKTTTLYAMLEYLNQKELNIVSLEDPVEYSLPGVNQVQINPRIGFDFAMGLRSVLRQDPDVIMVGEIRDAETARLALQAALTGHLVLSTLHTDNAAGAIIRLQDLGIKPYLISSGLTGVIAQRLVRKLCSKCSSPPKSHEYLFSSAIQAETNQMPVGCTACDASRYMGRTSLMEVMIINREIANAIKQGKSESQLEALAKSNGMSSLWEDGMLKTRLGITTQDEVARVLNPIC